MMAVSTQDNTLSKEAMRLKAASNLKEAKKSLALSVINRGEWPECSFEAKTVDYYACRAAINKERASRRARKLLADLAAVVVDPSAN